MRNVLRLKLFGKNPISAFAIFSVLLLAFVCSNMVWGSNVVYADPPNSVLATQKYCKAKVGKKLQSVCTEKNMNGLRDAVEQQCKDEKNQAACVEKAAEDVINQVVNKNPKDAKGFNDALKAALNQAQKEAKAKDNNKPSCEGSECTATPTGQGKNCDDKNCDLVALYINPFINLLSIVIGLVVAASLIMGAIQYTASSGDPQKTSAAKSRIQNTLFAFLAYAFMYAFLNFLIPGGLF